MLDVGFTKPTGLSGGNACTKNLLSNGLSVNEQQTLNYLISFSTRLQFEQQLKIDIMNIQETRQMAV